MPSKSTPAPARHIPNEPSDATESRLIEAAGQVFAEVGFQAATVREICARAGVNIASVNYYFGDKMGLYISVLRESMTHEPGAAVQLGVNAGKKDAREGLRLLLRAMFSVVLADERRGWYMRIMAHELANPTPALDRVASEVIGPNYKRLRGLIGNSNRPIGRGRSHAALHPQHHRSNPALCAWQADDLAFVAAPGDDAGNPAANRRPHRDVLAGRHGRGGEGHVRGETRTEKEERMSEQMVESKPQKGETGRDQPPVATPPPPARKIPKFVPELILLVLATAGYFTWKVFFAAPPIPDNIVVLSGRVEGDDSAVAPKTSGRIVDIRFREGDVVNAGDVIASLDDEQIRARENQAQAQVAQAEARLNAAQQQIGILNEQLQQSRIQVTQAGEDAQGRVHQAEAQVAQAEAQLAQQEAAYRIAAYDRDAYTKLAQSGAASERQARQMQSNADAQAALVAAARKQVDAARGALTAAKASLSNAAIRGSQSAAIQKQLVQEQFDIKSASADAQRARAQLNEAQANRQDLLVRAPFQGTIVTRTAEPGEVVTAGTPIVTLLDLTKVYLRGFVPEGQIGKVKVGQPARVYLDSNPTSQWMLTFRASIRKPRSRRKTPTSARIASNRWSESNSS